MRDFSHAIQDDDVCDEIDIDKVVALSPDHYVYENYDDIPYIPSPRFLMVKDKTIIADGWLIPVVPRSGFAEFILKMAASWNWKDGAAKNQLSGFIEAVLRQIESPERKKSRCSGRGVRPARLKNISIPQIVTWMQKYPLAISLYSAVLGTPVAPLVLLSEKQMEQIEARLLQRTNTVGTGSTRIGVECNKG